MDTVVWECSISLEWVWIRCVRERERERERERLCVRVCAQDYARALELFQKAAEKASAEAQYYLGHMFYGIHTCTH